MATKQQFLNAVHRYITNDMIPMATTARDEYRDNRIAVLRGAACFIDAFPNKAFKAICNFPLLADFEIVDGESIDFESIAPIIIKSLEGIEFKYVVRFLGMSYPFYISASDVQKIKDYL